MKVSAMTYINGYANPDRVEQYQTLGDSIATFREEIREAQSYGAGYDNGDGPGFMWIAYGHTDYIDYPDILISVGPRGGIIINRHC